MADIIFEVEVPAQDSVLAGLNVTAYVRRPAVLKLFEDAVKFSFDDLLIWQSFSPIPMPLEAHRTVIEYAAFLMEHWGKSTITVQVQLGDKVSEMLKNQGILKSRNVDVGGLRKAIIRAKNIVKVKTSVEKRLDKIEKNHDSEVANLKTEIINLEDVVSGLKMENINLKDVVSGLKEVVSNLKEAFRKESSDRDDYQFRIFRGNLLMDLMRKLFPDEAKKAAHQNTNPKWSSFAENLKEADFKKATKDFNVSEDSAQVMKVLQKFTVFIRDRNELAHNTKYDMARLLMSPANYDKGNNRFWRNLFEYVYEQTAEEMVQQAREIEDDGCGR